MTTYYEWDIEEVEGSVCDRTGDTEILGHDHKTTARELIIGMKKQPADNIKSHYCPCVVRDVFDKYQELQCRSWAYLKQDIAGKYTLPENFQDSLSRDVCKVPNKLHKELEKAQNNG